MTGPYETEQQVVNEPLPRLIRDLHDAGKTTAGDEDHLVRGTTFKHVVAACDDAGVALGQYDLRVLVWLAGWEPTTVQVVIGLIKRAYESGRKSG